MYKIISGILSCLVCCAAFAQSPRQPMGILRLELKSPGMLKDLSVKKLAIPTNQLITGLTECACSTGCNVVLPVILLSFEGRRLNADLVKLNWKTTNEYQNKGFEVQRSLGNTTGFRSIAFVPAQTGGAPEYEYELPDNNNYTGISYYRLKQVDIDDDFTFSETVAVKGYASEASLALYPNPVADKLVADIFSVENTHATLIITDATQKKLYSQPVLLKKGINLLTVPAAALSSGIYFVQLITEGKERLGGKFIKL